MLQIGEAEMGQAITVPVGQVVELRLAENPTTGFHWAFRRNGEPVCHLTEDFVQPAEGAKAVPGRGGMHVWRFRCVQAGDSELALSYGRSWEALPGAKSFDVHLHVVP